MYDVERIKKIIIILRGMGLKITDIEATDEWIESARGMRRIVDDTMGKCGDTVQGFEVWLDKSKFGVAYKRLYKDVEGCLFGIKFHGKPKCPTCGKGD